VPSQCTRNRIPLTLPESRNRNFQSPVLFHPRASAARYLERRRWRVATAGISDPKDLIAVWLLLDPTEILARQKLIYKDAAQKHCFWAIVICDFNRNKTSRLASLKPGGFRASDSSRKTPRKTFLCISKMRFGSPKTHFKQLKTNSSGGERWDYFELLASLMRASSTCSI
jgi:hypothetical protein